MQLQPLSRWFSEALPNVRCLPPAAVRFFSEASPAGASVTQPPPTNDTNYYNLQLILKSFELKYIHQASVTIRDLMLLNFAPKSQEVLPDVHKPSIPSNLIMTIGDVAIPQRIARYTVLRSPHVDKKSREQFEKRVYKRSIKFSTVSASELQWFLQHLKMYEFLGVQIQVNVASKHYLIPPAEIPNRSLLTDHRKQCSHLYSKAAMQPEKLSPAQLVQEAVKKLDSVVQTTISSGAPQDLQHTTEPSRRTDYEAILKVTKSVFLDIDVAGLNNSKLWQARFGAVSVQQDNAPVLIHDLMKLGLWLDKVRQLSGDKDARRAEEMNSMFEAVYKTLLEAYQLQQLQVIDKPPVLPQA